MKCRLVLLSLVAFQSIILFSTTEGKPQDYDSVDLFAVVKKRRSTTKATQITESTEPPPTTTTIQPLCETEDCPPSAYCTGWRNSECDCEYDCCYPSCPEGERIDYDNCPSCTNCTCLPGVNPPTTEFFCDIDCLEHPECDWRVDFDTCVCDYFNCGASSPPTTEFDCDITCDEHPECQWMIDYDVCQCVYNNCATTTTTTTTSTRRPKRIKCVPWFNNLFR